MAEVKIRSETPMDIFDVKEELAKIKKRDKELNFRAAKTEEYINQFASFKKAKELEEKIRKLNISRLKEQHIKKIVDLLPTTVKDLKSILQGYTLTMNKEGINKIVETVSEFKKKD